MNELPLRVMDLSKNFPAKRKLGTVHAVSNVSFDVKPGEITGFIGHNGAGKTTTIKCILGLLRPASGAISLWGFRPGASEARRRIGYVPENPDYDQSFSPLEYLTMFASMRGIEGSQGDWFRLLDRVGLAGWENTGIRQFSKGMRQRMSLALALQSKPEMLIMDEPTGGLDPLARKEFRDIIMEENDRGAAILLSSHILSEVEMVCQRAVMLSKGRLVAQGSMEELLGGESHYRIAAVLNGEQLDEVLPESELQGRIDSLRTSGAVIHCVERALKTLEEVYLSAEGGDRK